MTLMLSRGRCTRLSRMQQQPLSVPKHLDGRVHLEDFANPIWRHVIAPRHTHHFLEMHLLVRGNAIVVMGDKRVDLPTGSLLWVPPRKEHFTLETSPTLRRWILCVRVAAVQRILSADEAAPLLSRRGDVLCAQLPRIELHALARTLAEIAGQTRRGSSVTNAGLGYALTRALLGFGEAKRRDEPTVLHPAVARALSEMHGDGLLLSREELAQLCRLSPTHLSRLFVRELGQSLREVRNRKRIGRFNELMASGYCDSLTEAALEAGFGSYSQFHRVFTRLTGCSPSRRQV